MARDFKTVKISRKKIFTSGLFEVTIYYVEVELPGGRKKAL